MEPIGIALAIFIVLAAVTRAIANPLSAALVRARARRLPLPLRSRLEEEWLAELDAMPNLWERLLFAISLAFSRQRSFVHPAEGTAEARTHPALATAWTKCAHFLLDVGIGLLPLLSIMLLSKATGLSRETLLIFVLCVPWGRCFLRAGTDVGKLDWRLDVLRRIVLVPLIPGVILLLSGAMGGGGLGVMFIALWLPGRHNPAISTLVKRTKESTNGCRIAAFLKELFLWVPFALVLTGIVNLLPDLTGFSKETLFAIHMVGLSFMTILMGVLILAKTYRRAEFESLLFSWKRLAGLHEQHAPTETKYRWAYPYYAWRLGMNMSNVSEVPLAHPLGTRQHMSWCLGVIGFYVVYGGIYWIGLVPLLPGPGHLPLVVTFFLTCVSFAAVAVGFDARARVPRCRAGETIESHWEQPETIRAAGTVWGAFGGSAIMSIIGFSFTGMTVSLAVGAGSFLLLLLSGPRWLTPTRKGVSV